MTTITATPIPDAADELMAGRKYPTRFPTQPLNHETASVLLESIHTWWMDAAAGYGDLASAASGAGDKTGEVEALRDQLAALQAADHFRARGAGEQA